MIVINKPNATYWKPESLYQPATAIVERWDGTRWIEQRLVWDGEKYVPEVA
jgi:hypothetical protein